MYVYVYGSVTVNVHGTASTSEHIIHVKLSPYSWAEQTLHFCIAVIMYPECTCCFPQLFNIDLKKQQYRANRQMNNKRKCKAALLNHSRDYSTQL